jgi:predicted  nucleic acid-binding Zn-ribbon protein
MPDSLIQKLLVLQECDVNCDRLEQQLKNTPLEIIRFENKIKEEIASIELLKENLTELEIKRNDVDTRLGAVEEQIGKYKTQQLEVKKNDEYRALDHEISTLNVRKGELEDEELTVLIDIDEQKEKAIAEESGYNNNIKELEGHITRLRDQENEVETQLVEAKRASDNASAELDSKVLSAFKMIKTSISRSPYVVPLEGSKCTGCFIRVSKDVENAAHNTGELVRCSNCNRIVYHL